MPAASRSRRLQLARAVHEAGQTEVARALFVLLDEDLGRHGLEAWEPALAAECLVHHLRCVRGLVKGGRVSSSEVTGLFDRLCRLEGVSDPDDMLAAAALRCPNCGALGTVLLNYGPEAPIDDAEVLLALADERGTTA